ncbi:MAG TPA: threonine/serine dehydratase [Trueperaceae bacterium]
MLIPLDEILAARERLAPYLAPTPLKRADSYGGRLDATVLLKLELFQPTGAFKVRGALNALLSLDEAAKGRGVIASSAGNHGLGLAYAASTLGLPATVVLPASAPTRRAKLIERLGATVIAHGEDWNGANARALQLAEAEGLTYVSPFDDPAIMAGQGTIALELLEQAPDVEIVVCAVGGGGLISGVASAFAALRPDVRVIGVETEGADCMARSLAAGTIVELERFSSIATSLGTKRTQERPFGIVREAVERVEVVSDVRALEELLVLLDEEKLLVEPAASCTLAALVDGKVPDVAGAVIAPVMCGANVTLEQVLGWRESLLGEAASR